MPTTCPDSCLACYLRLNPPCDGSADTIREWLRERGVAPWSILRYLESQGGFCGCEALANALGRRVVLDDLVLSCS